MDKVSHFLRVPHRISKETPLAVWCADERGAIERGDYCTGEPAKVTCTECIRWMEKTLDVLRRWDEARATSPGKELAPGG